MNRKSKLCPLNYSRLKNDEFLSLCQQSLGATTDAASIDPYLAERIKNLEKDSLQFQASTHIPMGSVWTSHIVTENRIRNKQYREIVRRIEFSIKSDEIEEQMTARSLFILLQAYRGLDKKQSEAKTTAIASMIQDFKTNSSLLEKASELNVDSFFQKLAESNEKIILLCEKRKTNKATKPEISSTLSRNSLEHSYAKLAEIIVSLSLLNPEKVTIQELFKQFDALRKPFSIILKSRKTIKHKSLTQRPSPRKKRAEKNPALKEENTILSFLPSLEKDNTALTSPGAPESHYNS